MVRAWPAVLEARRLFVTWKYLLGNRDAGAESPGFAGAERLGAAHVRSALQAVLARVGECRYPFPHAHPDATIAMYLTEGCTELDLTSDEGLYTGAQERFDRCLRLYFGLLEG
jgi:hypothetical protein